MYFIYEKSDSVKLLEKARLSSHSKTEQSIEEQLEIEMNKQIVFTEPRIRHFPLYLRKDELNDIKNRRGFINIFVRAIYLYDYRMTIYLDGGDKEIVIDDIFIVETEEYFDSLNSGLTDGSAVVASVPSGCLPFRLSPSDDCTECRSISFCFTEPDDGS